MGFALAWLAVKDMSADDVCDMLELERTAEHVEVAETPLTGVEMPTGWYVIAANRCFPHWLGDSWFRKLSNLSSVIAGSVEEHVMYSWAERWDSGRQAWAIVHDANEGIDHLEVTGDLPEVFESIRQRQFERQEGDDREGVGVDHIFDVPVDVVEALTGFRYDKDLALGDNPFEVLKDTRKSFFAKLLDRVFRRG